MKDKAIKEAMNSIENRIRHVYNQGYEDGLKDGKESAQIDKSTAYHRGLNDAWKLARKLSNLGFNDTRKEIFGEKYGLSIDIIKDFSVDEVEAKIEECEEKQKRTCDTCKYGGHTLQDLTKCVYCDGSYYWTPKQTSKMSLDEAIKHSEEVADSKCDECGAEHRQLAEWLKELKELRGKYARLRRECNEVIDEICRLREAEDDGRRKD